MNFIELRKVLSLLLLGLLVAGCSSASREQIQDVEFRFNRGKELFHSGKYYKAIEDFNFVVLNNPGGVNADDAQLFIADSHFEVGEYVVAVSEYQRLLSRYPESPLVEQAQYKLGMCFVELSPHYQLQQDYTKKAINTLQDFLEDFPNTRYKNEITQQIDKLRDKLAHKMYSNGHLYYILKQYDSALVYYEQLLDTYYDTSWANITRLELARSFYNLERYAEAHTQIEALINRNPDSKILSEARRLLEDLQELEDAGTDEAVTQVEELE